MHKVLEGLQEMHQKGIVHCDIKPSNIMSFGEEWRWKIIDLESAKKVGKHSRLRVTYNYAAPEMIQSLYYHQESFDVKTSLDMFSFGVIVYELFNTQGRKSNFSWKRHVLRKEIHLQGRVEEKRYNQKDRRERDPFSERCDRQSAKKSC